MKPKKIETIIDHFNDLKALDTKENLKSPPITNTPITPQYVTHCGHLGHLFGIITDSQFGGKKVFSGNLFTEFARSNFSPIPLLDSSAYMGCLIIPSKKLETKTKKKFEPTLYELPTHNNNDTSNDYQCGYFDDEGWKSILSKKECGVFFHDEKEWKLDNPIPFDVLTDTEAILFKSGLHIDEAQVKNIMIKTLGMKGKSIAEIEKGLQKIHYAKYNRETKRFEYEKPMFDHSDPLERVLICDQSPYPMINSDQDFLYILKKNKKSRESLGQKGQCRYLDKTGNYEIE